jgi:hypothetical protein
LGSFSPSILHPFRALLTQWKWGMSEPSSMALAQSVLARADGGAARNIHLREPVATWLCY